MQEKDLVTYLKATTGYTRIIEAIIKKYKSLGKIGGVIVLDKLSDEEVKILSPYDYHVSETRKCKLLVKKFAERICAGKFEGIDFEEVLRLYSDSTLLTYKEEKEQKLKKSISFYEALDQELTSINVKKWLKEAIALKKWGYHTIHKLYGQEKVKLRKTLLALDAMEHYLNEHDEWILCPVLASQITGDTHYFDLNKVEGKLLLYFLSYKQGADYPVSVQEINEVFAQAKIVRDQISNSTTCYGLYGKNVAQNKPWQAFWEIGEPLALSIYNLRDVKEMTAMHQKVYIVENPAVFSKLLEIAIQKQVGLICTSGQLNTSSYMILDLLEASKAELYYNGDFDPEGLQIADKLKQRYKRLHLWCYSIENYENIKGTVDVEERLVKLNRIKSKELAPIIESMRKEKVAGYQETLVEELMRNMLF